KIDPIIQVKDILLEEFKVTDAEIEVMDQRVKDLVAECEKFAEESPYPEKNVMYDAVYEQKDYPFIQHKIYAMAEIINMPRLSDTMEEGTVATWLKKVGDKIEEGDILAEIETDKATMEFESFHEGTLLYIGVQEGETTKVDELLAILGEEGEDISELIPSSNSKKTKEQPEAKTTSDETDKPQEESPSDSKEDPKSETELPEGVIVVTMPRLSDTMEEGTVATWLKKIGDNVEEG